MVGFAMWMSRDEIETVRAYVADRARFLAKEKSTMSRSMLINGKLVAGSRSLDVIDPATGRVFATCACASREDIEDAVTAAAAAFPAWAATSAAERSALLIKLAEAIEANLESLARTLTSEQGKPIPDAQAEVGGAAHVLRYYAAQTIPIEVIEDSEARLIELHRRPLGVVAAIVPWNFPVITAINKVGAALLTGNTVVVKPAATTPLGRALCSGRHGRAIPPQARALF